MSVTDAQVDAALKELLHERNSQGDGCFGCGYGGWWGEKQVHSRIPFYRDMLKRILEAAGQAHVQPSQAQTPQPPPVAPRRRPSQDNE